MLLLRAEGLHSCPQMAWSQVRKTVAEILSPPDGLMLFCGMSIGYEDPAVRYIRTGRAPREETVTFIQDLTSANSGHRSTRSRPPSGPPAGKVSTANRRGGVYVEPGSGSQPVRPRQ